MVGFEYRKRIANFISKYVDIKDNRMRYQDNRIIAEGIGVLIVEEIFSPQELQRIALKEDGVFIPLMFIERCGEEWCRHS